MIDEVKAIIDNWRMYAEMTGVSEGSIKTIAASLKTVGARF